MNNAKKSMSKGLKRFYVITAIVAVLYAAAFFIYAYNVRTVGDPDLGGFRGVAKYHLDGIIDLFAFRYAGGSNIIYFSLSALLYAIIVCWIIFLVAGVIINDRKERKLMWWGIIFTFVNIGTYLVFASGSQKFWQIVNQRGIFEGNATLLFLTIAIIGIGLIYLVLTVLAYFWSIMEAFLKSEYLYLEEDDYSDGRIREIVKEELALAQPLKVVIVGNEAQPAKEEAEKEEIIEQVKEEKEIIEQPVVEEEKPVAPTVDFWQVAREVWPQLDNPKPLEVVKEEPVVEEINVDEDEDFLNQGKKKPRLPFTTRILMADADIKVNYNELKNEILSYGVKSRLARTGETFRLHTKKYVKLYLVGKTLKCYLALNPEDYKDTPIPVEDVGHRPAYGEIPLLFKVKSPLSVRRCKALIKEAMEKDGLSQGEVKDTNWVSKLRLENSQKAKEKKNN